MTDESVSQAANASRRYPPLAGVIALVFVTIIVYWPAIHAQFIWDDDSYVTENPLLVDAEGLRRIWIPRETPQYYPLVFSTFWVEYQLWELNHRGYHITNILLHAASAVLLWIVMIRLRAPGAWLIAAVFALHPVMVESVAWIAERKNVLSMFFYLAAALAYLRFDRIRFDLSDDPLVRREPWGWYGAAIVLFICALLSKTVTCSLPAALILVMLWLRVPITFKRLLPLAPMFVIGFVLAMVTVVLERAHVGAMGEEFDLSFIERSLIASKALLFYPWKILWPHPLMFIYPRWDIDAGDITQYWSLGLCMAIGIACVIGLVRGYRGPFVALSFYAGTVFPAIGFFNVYPHIFSFVADHFVYHASIGIIAFVIGGGAWLAQRTLKNQRIMLRCAAIVLLPILSALAWNHASTFYDAETVYRDTIAKNPDAWMPRNNLSSIYLRYAEEAMLEGDNEVMRNFARAAAEQARAALDVRPHHHTAHANLSEALRLLGEYDDALVHVKQAIEDRPFFPHYHWQKGRLHHLRGEYNKAIDGYAASVNLAPNLRSYRIELARLLMQEQRLDDAAEQLTVLLELDRDSPFALASLGAIRQMQQRDREAMRLLQRAVEQARTMSEQLQSLSRLTRLYATSDDPTVRDLSQALDLARRMVAATEGNDPGALAVLASVHSERGELVEAVEAVDRAIESAEAMGLDELISDLREQRREYLPR